MTIYSHSRLEAFENCPLMYKFSYIDRIRRKREGIEAFMGSRVHETLEKLYADLKHCKPNSEDDLVAFYHATWNKNWHDRVFVVKEEYCAENYREMGERCVREYYRHYDPFDDGRTLWLEQKVIVPLDAEGNYRMNGVIDRLVEKEPGVYEIHDYKGSGTLPDQWKFEHDRQLALYQLGVENALPDAREVSLVWHYLVFDKEMRSRRTPEQLDQLKSRVISLIDTIEAAQTFEPREGTLCAWCDYSELCPRRKHLFAVEQLPPEEFSADDGVQLVDRWVELKEREADIKAELKELKSRIDQYCCSLEVDQVRGSCNLLGLTRKDVAHFPEARTPERRALEELVRQLGHWDEVSSLDTRKLGGAFNRGAWSEFDRTQIDQFLSWEESITLRLKKAAERAKAADSPPAETTQESPPADTTQEEELGE